LEDQHSGNPGANQQSKRVVRFNANVYTPDDYRDQQQDDDYAPYKTKFFPGCG